MTRKEVSRTLVSGIRKGSCKDRIDINNWLIEEHPTEASKNRDELERRNQK